MMDPTGSWVAAVAAVFRRSPPGARNAAGPGSDPNHPTLAK